MGVEVSSDYGGAGCNFMTCIQVVEEISKVCPGVGALVDIHNTLVNPVIAHYGNEEQKKKYLPLLSNSMVSILILYS